MLCCHVSIILSLVSLAQCNKIHEMMTDDEINKVYRTTRENVPEYDFVPLMHNLYNQSNPDLRVQFYAFENAIDSYLNPTNGQLAGVDTPIWLAFTNENGEISYRRMREGIVGKVAKFYQNHFTYSSVVVLEDDSSLPSFEGNIDGLTIRSLPARLKEIFRSKREIRASNPNETLLETDYHVIIKSNSFMSHEDVSESKLKTSEILNFFNKTDEPKVKRSSNDVVFPSLMITTDYKGSNMSENDTDYYEEIICILAFWNAVDLRFRKVKDPKVRLRIAGIIIGQDRTATPYINDAVVDGELKLVQAWWAMKSFWYRMTAHPEFPKEAYHLIVTMTNYKMFGINSQGKRYVSNGISSLASLCEFMYDAPVSIIQDNGNFDGLLVATHELGHLLGVSHDNSSSEKCGQSHGYIMQTTKELINKKLEWSPCSLERLSTFLRTRDCAKEPSQFYPPNKPVERFLPGLIFDAHNQCQARGYAWACEPVPEICDTLWCYYTGWDVFRYGWWCKDSGPAIEGTICSPDHSCIDAECKCLMSSLRKIAHPGISPHYLTTC